VARGRPAGRPCQGCLGHRSELAITTLPDGTQALVDALWPTLHMVVVGDGLVAAAMHDMAAYLDWEVTVLNDVTPAVAAVQTLRPADAVLVLSHDHAIAGPVLQTALTSRAAYVGALGSRHTQQARAQWLTEREVPQSQIDRVRGPAGLDIGAAPPARWPCPSPPKSSPGDPEPADKPCATNPAPSTSTG
jgi:xanthine/CO dehydrogenase XdhC/CoxF family maturation factor